MNSCIVRAVLRLSCFGLWFGMLTLLAGCDKNPRTTKFVEVSGKVMFQGKPLPGGRITFVAVKGGFASTETIDESGHYQIKAPIGEVKISVDNTMLKSQGGGKRGGGPPKGMKHPRPPDSKSEEKPIKGQWVQIPRQYADADKSGLTYTVGPDPQTHDIELSDKPPSTK